MTSEVDRTLDRDTCSNLITLGYGRSKRVRLYGQELQLVSDPFPHDDGGIAVEVMGEAESGKRTMRLPLSVVQVATKKAEKRTA